VSAIDLSIGALSDLEPEWLQSYFDHISRGTPAEGARLRVRRSPLTFRCASCSREFDAARERLDRVACPDCGSDDASIVAGTSYTVAAMEAE
jgi:hydrogenase nickel incorporation protein HypA/HybF